MDQLAGPETDPIDTRRDILTPSTVSSLCPSERKIERIAELVSELYLLLFTRKRLEATSWALNCLVVLLVHCTHGGIGHVEKR